MDQSAREREALERLVAAAENYAIALLREALVPGSGPAPTLRTDRNERTVLARGALIDAILSQMEGGNGKL
jgi:hypothetical protein